MFAFILYQRRRIIHLSSNPFPSEKSLTSIRIPLVYILEKDECKDIYFSFYEKPSRLEDVNIKDLDEITKIISIIQEIKNKKLQVLLIDAFTYYYDALETSKYSIAFLKFWNIIERLLLKKEGITLTEITKRLISLYPDSAIKDDFKNLINILFQKRNLFVHESEDTVTSDDRDYMKDMVEHVIKTLLNLRFEFDNIEMMNFFYQNLRKQPRVIKDEIRVLELLEKIKSRENEIH